MKIYSYQSESGNIGDDFNLWIWPRLIPGFFDEDETEAFVGIGSVFDGRHQKANKKYVFGAGARSGCSIPDLDESWEVLFVRGPLTAENIKNIKVRSITDPGILASLYFERSQTAEKVGIVPYYKGNHAFWKSVARDLGMVYISPHLPVNEFFEKLSECKSVITESLHGAIFADALRIPWKGIVSYSKVVEGPTNNFKWNDWFGSMNVEADRSFFPVVWPGEYLGFVPNAKLYLKRLMVKCLVKKIMAGENFFLSEERVHKEKIDEILSVVDQIKLVNKL